MVLWWTTLIAIFGSMGAILLSIVMLAHIGDETDPWAIFWFFVAVGATGVLYLAVKADNSPAMRSVSWRPTKAAPVRSTAPVSTPAPVKHPKYWIVYHGTPTWDNAAGAIQNGFIPGPGGTYGASAYFAFKFELARAYSRRGGYIFKLYINRQTHFMYYSQIPGRTREEKREHCLRNGYGLVYVEKEKFFICYGYPGVPVEIPGLKKVEMFDWNGNQLTL